jgi:hypothetical protein
MSYCIDRRFVVGRRLPAIVPKRRDPGGRTCQMTFAGDPVERPTAVAAYVGRTVMDVEVVAAASRPDQPCFGSDSVEGKDRWSLGKSWSGW